MIAAACCTCDWRIYCEVFPLAHDFLCVGTMGFLAALLVFFIIPETHKHENRIPLRLNIIARNFMMLSKQKEVLGYMAAASFGFGGLICLSSRLVLLSISVFMVFQSINSAISL